MSYSPDPEIVRDVQRTLGAKVDGIPGLETWKAVYHHLVGDEPLASLPDAILAIQRALNFPPFARDGIAGAATWAAMHRAICVVAELPTSNVQRSTPNLDTAEQPVAVAAPEKVDPRSEAAIATLHPRAQPMARELVQGAAAHGITIVVTSALRTYAEQDMIFSQGRTRAGSIVTKARGGWSNHNFGIAFDVTIFAGGKPLYESPLYKAVAAIGKSLGLTWGGDWVTIHDEPHYELRPEWAHELSEGAMLAGLRARHEEGKDAFSA